MTTEIYLGYPPQQVLDWIKNHSQPPATPSPYFTYDSNRVITGLYQGEPNIQEEGGWTYGGSDVVENYATTIGDNAFNDVDYFDGTPPSKGITGNITFQNVTSIGEGAFCYCTNLTNITMPNVSNIGAGGFVCCSMRSITIPNVTSIGEAAFQGCTSLTSVTIPDSVTSIGSLAFEDCRVLTSVTITANGGNAANVKQMMIDAGVPENITWNIPN